MYILTGIYDIKCNKTCTRRILRKEGIGSDNTWCPPLLRLSKEFSLIIWHDSAFNYGMPMELFQRWISWVKITMFFNCCRLTNRQRPFLFWVLNTQQIAILCFTSLKMEMYMPSSHNVWLVVSAFIYSTHLTSPSQPSIPPHPTHQHHHIQH